MIRNLLLILLGLQAACGAAEPNAENAVPVPASMAYRNRPPWQMDPDIQRLFGPQSPLHALPKETTWAPDGRKIAFLRTAPEANSTPNTELWMYHLDRRIEIPLLTGDAVQVSEFCWVGSSKIAAVSNGDVWLVPLDGEKQQLTDTRGAEKGVQASPDGTKLIYIRDHNLILLDLISMMERPLTRIGNDKRTFGEVTWLYEEEFDTETGFGWAPGSDSIWFYETDLSNVPFRGIDLSDGTIKAIPYPRPGEPNPWLRVGILDITDHDATPQYLVDGKGKDIYLPRVLWHPNGKQLVITELDRLQTTLSLFTCDLATKRCSTLLTENDPRYVDLLDEPLFFNNGKELLRLSEASGYAHIQRVRLDNQGQKPLTKGSFEVSSLVYIDEKQNRVLFTANAEDTGEYKLYAVSLAGGEIMTIPQESGNHEVIYAPNGSHYIDTHSALDRPPKTDIKTSNGESIATLAETTLDERLTEGVTNELFPLDTEDGIPIMAHLTRPISLEPEKRYPVLIIVYGGPHVQLAKNAFHTTYQPWRNLLAQRGILVFTVDGRGSDGRGHAFESAVRLNLGNVELKDQLTGVAHLRSLPFVDAKRIGIFGWSYGGYMVLNALLRTKRIFKMGISVAPVTDWRYYDTAYTERYMQRPEDNPSGYQETALISLAPKLEAPLLLAHGIADDNVHLIHSHRLIKAFTARERYVDHLFYPGKGHKIGGPYTRVHLFTRITRFIEENL
jgi:dipeptidyl-peptidase 4